MNQQTTEPTGRDYALEVEQRLERENDAREGAADWLEFLLRQPINAGGPTSRGAVAIRRKEWRLPHGTQAEITVQRPDGVTLKFTITASEE